MAWNDYWRTQIDGIEEVEEHSEKSWLAALAIILLLESGLRRRLARRAAALPSNQQGYIDFRFRDAIRRFRSGSGRDIREWIREAGQAIAGRSGFNQFSTVRVPSTARAADAVRKAGSIFDGQWARGQRIVARDERGLGGSSGAALAAGGSHAAPVQSGSSAAGGSLASGSSVPSGGETLATAAALPVQPAKKARREIDQEELAQDQLFNLLRAFLDEGLRVQETLTRITGRFNKKDDALDFLLGQGDRRRSRAPVEGSSEGWHLDRNRLRLSFASHVRGAHRRRTVSEGAEAGVSAYRLDLPSARLGAVAPAGELGPHLWRVRTLDEWQGIAARANAGRIRSSGFDTLGLGFGDVSYIVAVPAIYLLAARKQGEEFRRKWMGG